MMAASLSDGDDGGMMSDINVTPLVDVVLVLLIVFMITMPAIIANTPIKVDLPETTNTADVALSTPDLLPMDIYVRREPTGEIGIYLGERPVDIEGLKAHVATLGRVKSEIPVKIAGDKGIPYGEIVRVMDVLGAAGIRKLQLDTKHVGGQ